MLAWIPGQLDPQVAESIASHLKTCLVCQTRLSTLKQRLSPAADGISPDGSSPATLNCELRPRPPRRLNDYELLSPIGRGGMGVVYRAVHGRLQREVAIKVLPHLDLADESAIVRIHRESAAAGRVRHPNIVFATDAGECEGIDYLVMELVDGTDLNKLVAALGPLPVPEACEIARQAALGLAHISNCGLVHRDLKPSNLMLARDGTVKILDLGLALLHKNPLDDLETTQPGYLLGTADYVAPEQVDTPHDADVRSDLYSLGCTFYRLLAGHAPFGAGQHESISRKVAAHRAETPPDIRTLRPEVPSQVAELIARLLQKQPGDRVQNPSELAEALVPHSRGADLAALIGRVPAPGEPLSVPSPLQLLETPSGASPGTTRLLTLLDVKPRAKEKLGRVPAWAAWLGAAIVLIGVIVATSVLRHSSIHYDLAPPLKEVKWISHVPSPAPLYDPSNGVLIVQPVERSFQLFEMGHYDGRPGTFSITLSPPTRAGMGLFFGQRTESKFGHRQVTVFQQFVVEYFPPGATGGIEKFRLMRQRAGIKLWPSSTLTPDAWEQLPRHEDFQKKPQADQLVLEIKFGPAGCESVRVNGQPLATLTTPDVNGQYRPEDYLGSFGLYCEHLSRLPGTDEPARFSELVFTPAEN
ncbi:MAG: serine/threonine protein kinase [Planctomycetaceae bacterium]|nr:serine/threonine protein kinase [Planctomycetaceae bacterium]